jgi:hypothetical protein
MQRRLEHPEPEGGGDVAVGLTSFDNVAEMLEELILQTVAPGKTGCCLRREAEARRSRCQQKPPTVLGETRTPSFSNSPAIRG